MVAVRDEEGRRKRKKRRTTDKYIKARMQVNPALDKEREEIRGKRGTRAISTQGRTTD